MKTCSKCKEVKEKSEFNKDRNEKEGIRSYCKECGKAMSRSWRERNREYTREKAKEWNNNNKERKKCNYKKWAEKNRDRINTRDRERYKTDVNFRLNDSMHGMVKRLKKMKSDNSRNMLGYSANDLRMRIEYQFEPGMSWENHGEVWHIDHKIPVSYFLDKGETRPYIINALSNLQPMWAEENRNKTSKFKDYAHWNKQ